MVTHGTRMIVILLCEKYFTCSFHLIGCVDSCVKVSYFNRYFTFLQAPFYDLVFFFAAGKVYEKSIVNLIYISNFRRYEFGKKKIKYEKSGWKSSQNI